MSNELPPLPNHDLLFQGVPHYTADQMRDYARAALAAHGIRSET